MRAIILLLALTSVFAADAIVEDFTLIDGRHLTGIYDSESQTLTLQGGVASMKVAADQIAERTPAKVADAPIVVAKDPERKAVRPASVQGLANPFDTPAVKAAADQYEAAKRAYVLAAVAAWNNANMKPVKIPELPKDPRESERGGRTAAVYLNNAINHMNGSFVHSAERGVLNQDGGMQQFTKSMNTLIDAVNQANKVGLRP